MTTNSSIIFKYIPKDHNICLILIMNGQKKKFCKGARIRQKSLLKTYTTTCRKIPAYIFYANRKRKTKVKLISIQMTPPWNINNMTVTYVVSVLWGPFFFASRELVAKKVIKMRINASWSYEYHDHTDRTKFANTITVDKEINKGWNRLCYIF